MFIIGVDFHPSFQQIAFMDRETGEFGERRLNHSEGGRSREVLSGPAAERRQCAGRDGGHRIFTLVRAVTRRTGY